MALAYFRNIFCPNTIHGKNINFSSQLRYLTSKSAQKSSQVISNTALNQTDDSDKPIEYLKSDAARWRAHVSRSGVAEPGLWYQPYVISISLAIFMIYFFYLREESDVDLEFNKNLYDRISGLEEKNLEIVLKYNKENNLPTSDIENRLQEMKNIGKNN